MYELERHIQEVVDEIDECIRAHNDEALTLRRLAARAGYSEYYMTRKFAAVSGLRLRDYLRAAYGLRPQGAARQREEHPRHRPRPRLFLTRGVHAGF